ncbi:type II secretion system minor pseudopilin GspI [Arenicella xantha]|uniref:Type II secretion system protein I n=1 Tax=Arenicella xantha TaxID=644221 RepID=A0A395JH52_9GAMM|nr:type II secretion system minor pseudopilin GspI [Arenicella xantha]RBP49246.1 type II secretion system protein I (GspI) [Arenicella xantha]
MINRNRQQAGFTLLEVLIALVFVAFGIVTVIEVTTQHVKNLSELEKRVIAGWVASNKVAEIRHDAKTEKLKIGSDTDRVKQGGMRWRTKAKIEKTDVERVFLLVVEVRDDNDVERGLYATSTTAVTDRS